VKSIRIGRAYSRRAIDGTVPAPSGPQGTDDNLALGFGTRIRAGEVTTAEVTNATSPDS